MTTRWWSALRLLERTVADPSVVEKESGLTEHLSTSASCEENDQLTDLRRAVDLLVEQQTCMQPVLSGGLRNGGEVCGCKNLTENYLRWEIKRQMKAGRGKEWRGGVKSPVVSSGSTSNARKESSRPVCGGS